MILSQVVLDLSWYLVQSLILKKMIAIDFQVTCLKVKVNLMILKLSAVHSVLPEWSIEMLFWLFYNKN